MQLSCREVGDRTIVELKAKRLDASVAGDFKQQMIELIESGKTKLLLDLGEVEFIDSSGLGALVGVYKQISSRGSLALARLAPAVQKVFALTRMNRVFEIHDAVPAA